MSRVDTYVRFAEAVDRLEIGSEPKGLFELDSGTTEGGAESMEQGAIDSPGRQTGWPARRRRRTCA